VRRQFPFAGLVLLPALFLLLVAGGSSPAAGAVVVENASGRAVLDSGADRARSQAVNTALCNALRHYIFEEQGLGAKFESQVNREIIARRNRFIQSYNILRERALGDLYQVDLRVELRADLIDRALAGIEQKRKQRVEHLTLVLLPPERSQGAVPTAPVLESSQLLVAFAGELKAYGFNVAAAGPLSADLKVMLARVLAGPEAEADGRRPGAALFKGLLPGDLIIVVRSSPPLEEKIVSLDKSLWKGRAELAFIDVRNDRIIRLAPVSAKVINRDYVAGLKDLTRTLTDRVRQVCLDRLLRDYVIPETRPIEVVLECRGFRKPADFTLFRKHLEALRSVSQVRVQALSAGLIELNLKLLTPLPTLRAWIDDFRDPEFPGRLTAYRVGKVYGSEVVMRVEYRASVPGD